MANTQPTYPLSIQSIHSKRPQLPSVLNRGVDAGDVLDCDDVTHAVNVATAPRGWESSTNSGHADLAQIETPALAPAVAASAENSILSNTQFVIGDVAAPDIKLFNDMNANINQLMEAVTSGFALVHAESANNSIRIMNRFVIAHDGPIRSVQKTVAGSGLQLAIQMSQDDNQVQAIQNFAALNPHGWGIGATPPFYHDDIDALGLYIDFLRLIYFYNEPMGIHMLNDDVAARKKAVRRFFSY